MKNLKPWQGYVFAVAVTTATLVLRLALDSQLDGQPALLIFTLPIMLSAYVGGLGAGLLATALCYFVASYFLFLPIHTFLPASSAERWQEFFIVIIGVVISVLIEALHRARLRADGSEKRLRDLIDGLGPAMFVGLMTPQGIVVEANRPALAAAGLKPEDVVGKRFEETYWWADSPENQRQLHDAIERAARGEPSRYDAQVRGQDNQLVDIDFSLQPLRDETGKVVFLVPSATVITERKRAEIAFRGSNEKFQQLAENVTDAFWIRSPDMLELLYLSPAFERIWGRSADSLRADPQQWSHFVLPDDLERVTSAFAMLKGDAPNIDIEYRIVRPNAEIRWIRVRGYQVRDAANKLIRLTGIVTDITEQRHAAEELRESERRFSDMMRNLDLVSMMLDREGRITYCNDYLLRLTGWRREEVIGRAWRELFLPPELVDELQEAFSALIADQPMARHHENDILTRSGARRLIHWNNSVLRSASGVVIGTASIGEDITERKRLEAQLFQSQKLETVGKLAGGVAHEFNNIMTAIIGESELILNDLSPDNPLVAHAAEIRKVADRAAVLTRQLLAYGRKQILQPEMLDLNSVVAGLEITLRHLMGRRTDVRLNASLGLKPVKADAGQIEQVIVNMAMNAADAMPDGGTLKLETGNVTLDQEYVRSIPDLKAGDYVMLSITDTGSGLSEEAKARLFEPFFTTKSVGEGNGLGLSTCYGIIKQSGGHISVFSELNRGAVFKIYLPQADQKTKNPAQRPDSPDLPRGTETILLVEEDPALREMASTLLRRLGYTVLAAADGIEALSLKQRRGVATIDLLFTDVVMPHMSGQELSERVLALYPYTRILFASAHAKGPDSHQAGTSPGWALLQKPFTPSGLARKLREVLDG